MDGGVAEPMESCVLMEYPEFSPDDFSFLCAFFHRPGKGRGPNGGWRGVLINNYKLVFIYLVTTLVPSKCLLEIQALFFWS